MRFVIQRLRSIATLTLEEEKAHPPEALSFDLVRRAFQREYGRRFEAFLAAGGEAYPVEPPALLDAEQRRAAFVRQFGTDFAAQSPQTLGIAVGKPVTASASLPDYPPELAVDGVADNLQSSWQTDPYPAWLQIDLEEPVKIGRIHVFPYWGGHWTLATLCPLFYGTTTSDRYRASPWTGPGRFRDS